MDTRRYVIAGMENRESGENLNFEARIEGETRFARAMEEEEVCAGCG